MATCRLRVLLAITLGSLVAAAAGCSAASGPPSERGYSSSTPGCSEGDCSACSTCVDSCACTTHGDPKCSQACSQGKGTGAGGSGSIGQGGSGTAGSPGAGGSSGSSGGSGSGGSGSGGSGYGGSGYGGSGSGSGYGGSGSGSGYGGSGSGGSGGSGAGGSGGSGSTSVQQAAIDRAKAGVGFSYWWGHGRFLPQGPTFEHRRLVHRQLPELHAQRQLWR